MTEAAAQSSEWPIVATDAGPVTLASVEQLESRAAQWRDWAGRSNAALQSLRNNADDHLAAAGSILVVHASDWAVPADLQSSVREARSLIDQIAADNKTSASLRQQEASSALLERFGAKFRERGVEQDRDRSTTQLRSLLVPIARSAPPTAVAQAEAERSAAADLESKATALETQIQAADSWASSCEGEVARRKEAIKAMGFDSLYETAVLQTSGAQTVESPLVMKAGERAYLAVSTTLARMVSRTHYVGGSSGFSFPIGHTGIRYRVGSFRGQPVHQQSLTKLDTGTFVLTNQRIAYVGRTKSTSVPLSKVMHVEVYNDAISIAREGRENPDFYLMGEPKRAVFLINWVLSTHAG